MSATDGTGDYGEDEGQDTWQPADTKLELQMKALEQGRTMSAFDDWYNKELGYPFEPFEKSDMRIAFNAGLEAGKAERDRVMRENGKLNCHIDDLEMERDRLRKAIQNYLDCQTTNQWVTHFRKALEES